MKHDSYKNAPAMFDDEKFGVVLTIRDAPKSTTTD